MLRQLRLFGYKGLELFGLEVFAGGEHLGVVVEEDALVFASVAEVEGLVEAGLRGLGLDAVSRRRALFLRVREVEDYRSAWRKLG